MTTDLASLCDQFLDVDRDAFNWAHLYPDEEEWESPDCDVMSKRFINFCADRGVQARLVKVVSDTEGWHYFAVIGTTAVDWTAKQFYNVPQPPTDPGEIACPLTFEWPGRYPIHTISFKEEHPVTQISCPVLVDGQQCGGEIELTRKTYWSIEKEDGYLYQIQTDQPDMWIVYCENDHQLYGDPDGIELDAHLIVKQLTDLFRDHAPEGAKAKTATLHLLKED